jgi:predicted GNAT family N-acyltransferase
MNSPIVNENIKELMTLAFGKWKEDERKLLYFTPTYRHLFLYEEDTLVSYMRIIIRDTKYLGNRIRIGGIGDVSTHPKLRGRGFATLLVKEGMKLLKDAKCDIGLLQTDPRKGAQLYKASGFVVANRSYTFQDAKGKLHNQWKQAVMLAPINNQQLFEEILNSKKMLYIGKGRLVINAKQVVNCSFNIYWRINSNSSGNSDEFSSCK